MSVDFSKKSCFVFDAYGTLFDVDTSLDDLPQLSPEIKKALMDTWRSKQLEYTWLRSLMERYCSFQQVTEEALNYALEKHQIESTSGIVSAFMKIYLEPTLKPGAKDLLEFLKEVNVSTAILSNGTKRMLETGVDKCAIENLIEKLLSVEAVSEFKPSPNVYRMIQTQVEPDVAKVLFISGNPWDVSGASTFGLDCAWINSSGKVRDRLPYGEVIELTDLSSLREKLREDLANNRL